MANELNKKEQELMDELLKNKAVIVDDDKMLKKIAPKLEKIYGRADEIYEQIK